MAGIHRTIGHSCYRLLTTTASQHSVTLPPGFTIWPKFFSVSEQKILLRACLHKLDSRESMERRRRMKLFRRPSSNFGIMDQFLPDELYGFEEVWSLTEILSTLNEHDHLQGHYDGVIRHFREMHLSSWPEDDDALKSAIQRLHTLFPTTHVQTHLLHLASYGEILPHVDNVTASGS